MGYSSSVFKLSFNKSVTKSQLRKKYNRFNYIFVLATLLPLFSIGYFNIMIDPYGVFASDTIQGVNDIKPEKENLGRLYKAIDIRRIKPKIIFLGSSRVETGLNVKHPAFENQEIPYNLGFQAGNTYEIMRYFQYALAQQPQLKQVIIGIDFFMFNANLANRNSFSENRLGKKFPVQDFLNATLSIDAFISSKNTLIASINRKSHYNRLNIPIERFKFWLSGFLGNRELYAQYKLSQERLANLQTIIEICQQNNIDIKVFISPTHATQYEAIAAAGLWSTFEQWKREITKITPVWDFSGYNSITIDRKAIK